MNWSLYGINKEKDIGIDAQDQSGITLTNVDVADFNNSQETRVKMLHQKNCDCMIFKTF